MPQIGRNLVESLCIQATVTPEVNVEEPVIWWCASFTLLCLKTQYWVWLVLHTHKSQREITLEIALIWGTVIWHDCNYVDDHDILRNHKN